MNGPMGPKVSWFFWISQSGPPPKNVWATVNYHDARGAIGQLSDVFGFVDGAYWFHVGLLNRDSQVHRWILVLDYVLLDQIDVRVRRADGSVTQFASGDFHPFSARIALPIAEFPDRPC